MLKMLQLGLLFACLWLVPQASYADAINYKVLGVIAAAKGGEGIALLKAVGTGKTFAVREGKVFGSDCLLTGVTRTTVTLKIGERSFTIKVGEDTATYTSAPVTAVAEMSSGIEKRGDTTLVSASLRDHLVNNQLSEVLMQAAAVPHYDNGELIGFRIWDITPGSIYEKLGLENGDIVKEINDKMLNDVRATISLLMALKKEPRAELGIVRGGVERRLKLVVQ